MAKRGFVCDSNWNIIVGFKSKTELAEDISRIFNYKVAIEGEYDIRTVKISEKHIVELRDTIKNYLEKRNNEEPDYGIDWKQSFKREQVYTKVKVLGNMMELYSGNEDLNIHYLANLENTLEVNTDFFLFGAKNLATYEFIEKMKKSITLDMT